MSVPWSNQITVRRDNSPVLVSPSEYHSIFLSLLITGLILFLWLEKFSSTGDFGYKELIKIASGVGKIPLNKPTEYTPCFATFKESLGMMNKPIVSQQGKRRVSIQWNPTGTLCKWLLHTGALQVAKIRWFRMESDILLWEMSKPQEAKLENCYSGGPIRTRCQGIEV